MPRSLALLLLLPLLLGAEPYTGLVSSEGAVSFEHSGKEAFRLYPGLFAAGWRSGRVLPVTRTPAAGDTRRGVIHVPDSGDVSTELHGKQTGNGIELDYTLTTQAAVKLNSLHVSFSLPEAFLAGATYTADGQTKPIPPELGETHIRGSAPAPSLKFAWPNGEWLLIEVDGGVPVLLQDGRRWGPSFEVRIGPQMDAKEALPKGHSLQIGLRVQSSEGMKLDFDRPVTIEAGEEWTPLALELDIEPGSALDFSGMGQFDAPAGKHGWLTARPDGKFVFQDSPDQARRFYGVNFCFSAQYLAPAEADRVAERLYRLGYNTVRLHHYESTLQDRSKGSSTDLNPERLEQLDYLFAALKKRGIYVTTDCYVSRKVFAADIWPGAEKDVEMDEFKLLVPVNEKAYENWKTFTRNLLTHRNPHTGLRYADDPTLAWLAMINEGTISRLIGRVTDRVRPDWEKAWGAWLKQRYGTNEAVAKAWGAEFKGDLALPSAPLAASFLKDDRQSRDFAVFLAETDRDMFLRMKTFLREEIGTKALLTNMNCGTNTRQNQLARAEFDYVDDHFYVDHPQFVEQRWRLPSRCGNTSPVLAGAPGGRGTAFTRVYGKPFTISEYNYSGPGRFRGVGGILTGCMAAVQDWSVLWRFAYSHSRDSMLQPRWAGYFDVSSDPLNQAAERASICLFVRGDMAPAPRSVAVTFNPADMSAGNDTQGRVAPDWSALVPVIQVGTFLGSQQERVPADLALPDTDSAPANATAIVPQPYGKEAGTKILEQLRQRNWLPRTNVTDLGRKRGQSANNQFLMDGETNCMVLDTQRTAGCYAPAGKTVHTQAADFAIGDKGEGATVWVSSLDGKPITTSTRLLLTHLTDLQNTSIRYAEKARKTTLSWGKLPHLVRIGEARVTLRHQGTALPKVYALATSGRRLAEVPVTRDAGGSLVLQISTRGEEGARMLYEIDFR